MVFVSHDRYFIDKLATRVFEVEEGRVHVYPGQLRGLSVAEIGRPGNAGRARGSDSGGAPVCARAERLRRNASIR